MGGLDEALYAVGAGERPATFDRFAAAIDPEWIARALALSGTVSVRRRKLPVADVVWLVIGMGLFRDRPIAQIVDQDYTCDVPRRPPGGRPSRHTDTARNRTLAAVP